MTEKKTTRFNFSKLKKPSYLISLKHSPISSKKGMLTTRNNTTRLSELQE
jgi:hypothetical protein